MIMNMSKKIYVVNFSSRHCSQKSEDQGIAVVLVSVAEPNPNLPSSSEYLSYIWNLRSYFVFVILIQADGVNPEVGRV